MRATCEAFLSWRVSGVPSCFCETWGKDFLEASLPGCQSLLKGPPEHRLEFVSIGVHSVWPHVWTHNRLCAGEIIREPRQHSIQHSSRFNFLERDFPCLKTCLQNAARKPGMCLRKRSANAHHVHNREHPGPSVICLLGRAKVWKYRPTTGAF